MLLTCHSHWGFLTFTLVLFTSALIIYLAWRCWGCRAKRGCRCPQNLAVCGEEDTDGPDLTSTLVCWTGRYTTGVLWVRAVSLSSAAVCPRAWCGAWHSSVTPQIPVSREGVLRGTGERCFTCGKGSAPTAHASSLAWGGRSRWRRCEGGHRLFCKLKMA